MKQLDDLCISLKLWTDKKKSDHIFMAEIYNKLPAIKAQVDALEAKLEHFIGRTHQQTDLIKCYETEGIKQRQENADLKAQNAELNQECNNRRQHQREQQAQIERLCDAAMKYFLIKTNLSKNNLLDEIKAARRK